MRSIHDCPVALWHARTRDDSGRTTTSGGICMNRTQTFQMALAYLVVLLILGVLYALPVLAFVPDTLVSVPVAVP